MVNTVLAWLITGFIILAVLAAVAAILAVLIVAFVANPTFWAAFWLVLVVLIVCAVPKRPAR